MATAWRRVKAVQDTAFTIRDLLKVYEGDSAYATYDASACEWNQFLKDFCADEGNDRFKPKLQAAAALWNIIRASDQPKIYSPALVQENMEILEKFASSKSI